MAAPRRTLPTEDVLEPPGHTAADLMAMRALQTGTASDEQQKLALDWIITQAARLYDEPYRPKSNRDTDFALGKAYVGRAIVRLLNMKSPPLVEGSGGKPPP